MTATAPPASRDDPRRFAVLVRTLLRIAAAALVVYHAVLLWDRVASLTLLDPVIALRWAAAAALAFGLVRMQLAGVPLLAGRRALIVWTLVALLHAGMAPGAGALAATLAESDAGALLTLGLSALVALLGTVAGEAIRPPHTPGRLEPVAAPAFRAACLAPLSPRPPPAR